MTCMNGLIPSSDYLISARLSCDDPGTTHDILTIKLVTLSMQSCESWKEAGRAIRDSEKLVRWRFLQCRWKEED